jgi:hypothetical protein
MFRYEAGQVVLLDIKNLRENRFARGKLRPGLLVRPVGKSRWLALGLTSQPTFKSTGTERVPVYASARNGLWGHGYLWSSTPVRVPLAALDQVIGGIDEHLAEVVARHVDLPELDIARLRAIARSPRPFAA